jgi:hypothetical protein
MTPTEIQSIANKHIDLWMQSDATDPASRPLRQRVEDAITEALAVQAEEYRKGQETLRHERDAALQCRDEAVLAAHSIAEELATARMGSGK